MCHPVVVINIWTPTLHQPEVQEMCNGALERHKVDPTKVFLFVVGEWTEATGEFTLLDPRGEKLQLITHQNPDRRKKQVYVYAPRMDEVPLTLTEDTKTKHVWRTVCTATPTLH